MRLLPHPSVLRIPLSFHFAVLPWSSLCCPSSPLSSLLLSRCSSLLCSVLPRPSSHPSPPPPIISVLPSPPSALGFWVLPYTLPPVLWVQRLAKQGSRLFSRRTQQQPRLQGWFQAPGSPAAPQRFIICSLQPGQGVLIPLPLCQLILEVTLNPADSSSLVP